MLNKDAKAQPQAALPGVVRLKQASANSKIYPNKIFKITTNLIKVTPNKILYEQTDMKTIQRHVCRQTKKIYFKRQRSDNYIT
jgi:hypothetical protein